MNMLSRVGFDLTTGYGYASNDYLYLNNLIVTSTAAVKFRNGSFATVAKINGSEEYISAMKQMAYDVERIKADLTPTILSLPSWFGVPEKQHPDTPMVQFMKSLWQTVAKYTSVTQKKTKENDLWAQAKEDPWTIAVAGMIRQLKDTTEANLGIDVTKVILSYPTYLVKVNNEFIGNFRAACQLVGVQEFRASAIASLRVVELYGIRATGSDEEANGERPGPEVENALVISYSDAGLEGSLLTGEAGVLFPHQAESERFDLGAGSGLRTTNASAYWGALEEYVRKSISPLAPNQVARLVLLGDRATDPMFLRSLARLFTSNSLTKTEAYEWPAEEHLFAAARGAAAVARVGLQSNWEYCIPLDYCARNPEETDHAREL
ncbi:hypothetical protein MMC13_001367 [Lambiella insularis]|nr:hypothetical protein [Lambiella insularis]